MASATGTRTNEPETLNPRRQILNVAPLNSVPYIGPPLFDTDTNTNTPSTEPKNDTGDSVEKLGPAMIYCPLVTRLEWNNIVAATKTGIALTGAAAMGKVGPVLGSMDVGESKDSFFFRVSLPGVAGDEKEFSCDIEPDGKVTIKGVTTTGEKIVCKNSQVFKMQSQNLCPPGYFSLSFQLPGPVKHQQFSGVFTDGILEGVVTKMEINNV